MKKFTNISTKCQRVRSFDGEDSGANQRGQRGREHGRRLDEERYNGANRESDVTWKLKDWFLNFKPIQTSFMFQMSFWR